MISICGYFNLPLNERIPDLDSNNAAESFDQGKRPNKPLQSSMKIKKQVRFASPLEVTYPFVCNFSNDSLKKETAYLANQSEFDKYAYSRTIIEEIEAFQDSIEKEIGPSFSVDVEASSNKDITSASVRYINYS